MKQYSYFTSVRFIFQQFNIPFQTLQMFVQMIIGVAGIQAQQIDCILI